MAPAGGIRAPPGTCSSSFHYFLFPQVTYRAVGFIEKNRDTLSSNMQKLMEQSHNKLVNELFTAKVKETGTLDMR